MTKFIKAGAMVFACLWLVIGSSVGAYTELSPAVQAAVRSMGLTPLANRTKAIDFSLKTVNGKTVKLSDFTGKLVMLNFWATWCPPCRTEMPSMQKLHQATNSKNFVILAIDLQEAQPAVLSHIKNNRYTFPVLLDSDGAVASRYGVRAIPSSFLIDASGAAIAMTAGAHDFAAPAFQKGLTTLLGR